MLTKDLKAGKRWVERRFEEIAREFGVPRALAQEDRWREIHAPFVRHNHSMAYYIELGGRLKRGEVTFWDGDLEIAGTGELATQERLGLRIRDVLASSSGKRK